MRTLKTSYKIFSSTFKLAPPHSKSARPASDNRSLRTYTSRAEGHSFNHCATARIYKLPADVQTVANYMTVAYMLTMLVLSNVMTLVLRGFYRENISFKLGPLLIQLNLLAPFHTFGQHLAF
jgi:hypothetical protein